MSQILDKSFIFSVRTVELAKYLIEENRPFPLSERLLSCAAGLGVSLRLAEMAGKENDEHGTRALSCAMEAEYLLELMVKTGYLQEKQSKHILSDCCALKAMIADLFQDSKAEKEAPVNQST